MTKLYVITKQNGSSVEIVRVMLDINSALKYSDAIKGGCYTTYIEQDITTLDELTIKSINSLAMDVMTMTDSATVDVMTWTNRLLIA